jgi:hypothetical protein
MESKVLLFDENGVGIGETFMRRARQLVSRQRAEWIDESHSAIRFSAGGADVNTAEPAHVSAEEHSAHATAPKTESALYELAQRRIRERGRFILHTLLFLFLTFCLLIILDETYYREDLIVTSFFFGCNFTLYAVHVCTFARKHIRKMSLPRIADYRARKLAAEVDKLKRMGYTE